MPFTLDTISGFADVSDDVFLAEAIDFGIHLGQVAENAEFGMVRREIFTGIYKDGETVILPTSPRDGYNYQLDELQFFWTVRNSASPASNWITGPDCLWFCNWKVDQDTGLVHSEEWYRRSGEHDQNQNSQDGSIMVF